MTHHNGPTVDQFQGAVHRHRVVGAQLRAGAVAAWGVDHPHQCGAGVRAVGGHHGGTRAQPERVGRGSDQAQGRIPAAILICWSSPARRATSTCWIATTSAAWASPPPAATRWYTTGPGRRRMGKAHVARRRRLRLHHHRSAGSTNYGTAGALHAYKYGMVPNCGGSANGPPEPRSASHPFNEAAS